jgi:hypothetical protein
MQIDGFWVVRFTAAQVSGSGVVVFTNGRLFGGETGFYYIGNYDTDGNIVKARVMVRHFDPAVPSGFGISGDYELDVSVVLRDAELVGTAVVPDHPQYSLGIRLTKKADL